jgi:hypothetical protein
MMPAVPAAATQRCLCSGRVELAGRARMLECNSADGASARASSAIAIANASGTAREIN